MLVNLVSILWCFFLHFFVNNVLMKIIKLFVMKHFFHLDFITVDILKNIVSHFTPHMSMSHSVASFFFIIDSNNLIILDLIEE